MENSYTKTLHIMVYAWPPKKGEEKDGGNTHKTLPDSMAKLLLLVPARYCTIIMFCSSSCSTSFYLSLPLLGHFERFCVVVQTRGKSEDKQAEV